MTGRYTRWMLHLFWLLSPAASAAPLPPPPAPLAIPGEGPPPARIVRGPRDDALAAAIRAYRERELTLADLQLGGTQVAYSYIAFDPYFGATAVAPAYSVRYNQLTVLQGNLPLTVPETYAVLGDTAGRDALVHRITNKRRAGTAGFLLGLGGMAATAVGLSQLDRARGTEEMVAWSRFTAGSAGVMAFGFVVGGLPATKAHRLEHEIEKSFDLAELERRIDAHNEALARELGLSAAEVARIERVSPR